MTPPIMLSCGLGQDVPPSSKWLVWVRGPGVDVMKLVTTKGEAVLFLRRWSADRGLTLSADMRTMERKL